MGQGCLQGFSLSLWWQGGEIPQEWEGRTALQVRVPGQGVGVGAGTLSLLGMCWHCVGSTCAEDVVGI